MNEIIVKALRAVQYAMLPLDEYIELIENATKRYQSGLSGREDFSPQVYCGIVLQQAIESLQPKTEICS